MRLGGCSIIMASAHEIAIHLVTVVKSKNSTIPFILLTSIMVSVIFFANIAIPPRNNISLLQSRLFPATIPGNSDPVGDEWPIIHGHERVELFRRRLGGFFPCSRGQSRVRGEP